MMPTGIPTCPAVDCAAETCVCAIHCNHSKKSTSSACSSAKAATAGELGRRSSWGHSDQRWPWITHRADQTPKLRSPTPSRRRKSS